VTLPHAILPAHPGGSLCGCAGYVSNRSWSDAPDLGGSGDVQTGNVVMAWQIILWADGRANECDATNPKKTGFDGEWGPLTESATKTWQRQHNLTADGVVGPNTWGKVRGKLVNDGLVSGGVTGFSYHGSAHTIGYIWNDHFFSGTPAWFAADPLLGDMIMEWFVNDGIQC
jgi:Putative peptidoglycan binding domain